MVHGVLPGRQARDRLQVLPRACPVISPGVVGTLLCLSSAAGYASVNLLLRRMAVRYDPLWIIWLKETITIVPLMPYLMWSWARREEAPGLPRPLGSLIVVGLLTNTIATPGLVWAMGVVGVAVAVPASLGVNLITCAALGWVYLGERVTGKTALAGVLLILSVSFLSVGAQQVNASLATSALAVGPLWVAVAVAASVVAGLVYGGLNVVIRRAATDGMAMGTIAFLVPAMGSVTLGPICLWRYGLEGLLAAAPEDLAIMVACGLLNLLAFLAIIQGLKMTSVVRANVLAASQAAVAAVGGLVFFDEAASPALGAGVSLAILGTLLLDRQGSPRLAKNPPDGVQYQRATHA